MRINKKNNKGKGKNTMFQINVLIFSYFENAKIVKKLSATERILNLFLIYRDKGIFGL